MSASSGAAGERSSHRREHRDRTAPTEPLAAILADVALGDDLDQAVPAALTKLDPRPDLIWIAWRGDRLVREAAGTRPEQPDVAVADLTTVWTASRESPVVRRGRYIGIDLRHESQDPVTGDWSEQMLVLVFADAAQSERFAEQAGGESALRLFGRVLAALRYRAIDQRITTATRDILLASPASRPADACRTVAEAIGSVTRSGGPCLILTVLGAGDTATGEESTLELVALTSDGPSDERTAGTEHRARHTVPWRPPLGAKLTDSGGRSLFLAHLRGQGSRAPDVAVDSYEVVESGPAGADRSVARLPAAPSDQQGQESLDADQPLSVVRALLLALHQDGLLGHGSSVTVPLFDAGDLLGFLVTGSPSAHAFTGRDAVRIWQLGLLAVRPLARVRQLESDFELASLMLREAAALSDPSPQASGRHAKDLLAVLCERLRRVVGADSVVLLPYDHKRDRLVEDGVAHAGPWRDVPRPRRRSRRGVINSALRLGEAEWSIETGVRFEPGSFVGRHDVGRMCAKALRSSSGTAIGVLICNWARTPEQEVGADVADPVNGPDASPPRRDSPSAELLRMRAFAAVAAEFLQRQIESSNLARLHDVLFDLYGGLLVKAATAFADDRADTPRKIRDELLEQILNAAIAIVGGTSGVFAMPSFDHDGLDIVVSHGEGRDPARISYGEGTTGACALQGLVQVIPDSQDRTTYPPGVIPIRRLAHSRSEIAYPVKDGQDRLLGVIDLENEIAARAFVEADATPLLQPLAQAATLVIQLTDSIAHLASIARLSRALDDAQGKAEDTIANVVLEEVRQVTGAFAAGARVPDQVGTSLIQLAQSGQEGTWTWKPIPLERDSANTSAYRQGNVVHIEDVRKIGIGPIRSKTAYLASRPETRSEITLPVFHHAQLIGVLDFDHRQPGAFVASEPYLSVVARQFGHAISARRDSQRRLVEKSIDMVKVLNAYYVQINHSIAAHFTSIMDRLGALESKLPAGNATLATDLRAIFPIAESGIRDADELLAASAGSYETEGVFDVRRVLRSAIPLDRQDRFDLDIGYGEPVPVFGREQMLRWVFREVVANSLKYGGDAVSIKVALEVSDRVVAVLEDDGPGIESDQLEDLFTVRGRQANRGRGGGGMALVGARAFLETMRGSIEATPVSPQGLRTTITLPIHRSGDGD